MAVLPWKTKRVSIHLCNHIDFCCLLFSSLVVGGRQVYLCCGSSLFSPKKRKTIILMWTKIKRCSEKQSAWPTGDNKRGKKGGKYTQAQYLWRFSSYPRIVDFCFFFTTDVCFFFFHFLKRNLEEMMMTIVQPIADPIWFHSIDSEKIETNSMVFFAFIFLSTIKGNSKS